MDVLSEAVRLAEARQPFVLVSVIWRRGPSSGRQGSKAIILADGTIRGWLGGACAAPTVVTEATEALADGHTRLLFLGQPHELDERHHEGLTSVPMACESEGALEVYLEPMLPPPQIVAIGRSPAVDALAQMATALGWTAVVVDDGGDPTEHAQPDLVQTKLDLGSIRIDGATAVVVATQGHYDDLALSAALETEAGYIGLVASAKRAETVLGYLSDEFDGVALSRIHAPAGADLGHLENVEIAVALLADLVARRAHGELVPSGAAVAPRVTALDPVCGMTVDVADAKYHSLHDGDDYWFCAPGCQAAFDRDPAAFLS
jgi:xanthine dehydrogenase accessory factor